MSTGWRGKFTGVVAPAAVLLCFCGIVCADSAHGQRKLKKAPPPPPLPSGPTGRQLPQVPLDSIAPIPPQVTFQGGQLTIVAPNSTLSDILKAVHKQTGAEIEVPSATDRVVTQLGPGPAREVMAELLNGSRFNYVLLGSPEDANALTRVVLVAKAGGNTGNTVAQMPQASQPPENMPPANMMAQQQPEPEPEAEPPDDTTDDSAQDQPVDDQQQPGQDQQGVKTPQQMLQEMQQRQMQIQQQQQQIQQGQPGQMPPPGLRPPERNDPQQ